MASSSVPPLPPGFNALPAGFQPVEPAAATGAHGLPEGFTALPEGFKPVAGSDPIDSVSFNPIPLAPGASIPRTATPKPAVAITQPAQPAARARREATGPRLKGDTLPASQLGITAVSGPATVLEGAGEIAKALSPFAHEKTGPRLKANLTEKEKQAVKGATKVLAGAMETGSLLIPAGLATAPLKTVATLAAATAADRGAVAGLEAVGVSKEWAELGGALAGVLAAGKGAHEVYKSAFEKVYKAAGSPKVEFGAIETPKEFRDMSDAELTSHWDKVAQEQPKNAEWQREQIANEVLRRTAGKGMAPGEPTEPQARTAPAVPAPPPPEATVVQPEPSTSIEATPTSESPVAAPGVEPVEPQRGAPSSSSPSLPAGFAPLPPVTGAGDVPEPVAQAVTPTTPESLPEVPDAVYAKAVEMVRAEGKASTSFLQRNLRLGYGAATRVLERMEKDGLIGPADGSKPRSLLDKAAVSNPPAAEGKPAVSNDAATVKSQAQGEPVPAESTATTGATTTTNQAPPPEPHAPVVDSKPQSAAATSLPHDLAGAKPRYSFGPKQFDLTFASDVDRAAYITAQEKPSKRDADYLKFAMDASGLSETEVRTHGAAVRSQVKAIARDAKPGKPLSVPQLWTPKPAGKSAAAKPHDYASTQVNLPAPIADQVRTLAGRIPDELLAKDGRESEPHVTVKYGLHGEDPAAIQKLLENEPPIKVRLGKTSLFQNEDADVVKIDVDSEDLHRLNAKIAAALPHTETHPTYTPHVTVAFLKPGEGKRYDKKNMSGVTGQEFTLDTVSFSDKNGNKSEVRLGGERRDGLDEVLDDIAPRPQTARVEQPGTQGNVIEVPETQAAAARTPEQHGPGWVGNIPTSEIHVDAPRFQFKANVGQGGAGEEFRGVTNWDPEKAGITLVWRDPANGKTYVVNGHHRMEMAQRLGVPEMTVRYLNAATAEEARVKGALVNIAEGRGESTDAAKVFRDSGMTPEDLQSEGISLKGKVANEGLGLAQLAQPIFNDVISGDLNAARGAVIGSGVKEHTDQIALYDLVRQRERSGKRLTNNQIAELIRLTNEAPKQTETQESLFGVEEMTRSLLPEKAEVSDYVRQELGKERRLFGVVGTQAAAERLGQTGNVIKADENAQQAEQANRGILLYDKLSAKAGPISQVLDRSARAIAEGEGSHEVKQRAYREIRDHLSGQIRQLTGVPQRSPVGAEGHGTEGPGQTGSGQPHLDGFRPSKGVALPGDQPLFDESTEAQSRADQQSYEDRLLGQQLTAQMKSGLPAKPAKLKPAQNRGLFEEEGPEQESLFDGYVPPEIPRLPETARTQQYARGAPSVHHAANVVIRDLALNAPQSAIADAYVTNRSGMELLGRAAGMPFDYTGGGNVGIHISPADAGAMARNLASILRQFEDGPPAEAKRLQDLFSKAEASKKSVVLIADAPEWEAHQHTALAEELSHAIQAALTGKTRTHFGKSLQRFTAHPIFAKAVEPITDRYGSEGPPDWKDALEVGVRLMRPDGYKELEIPVEDARRLAAEYVRTLRGEHGSRPARIVAREVFDAFRGTRPAGGTEPGRRPGSPGPKRREGPGEDSGPDLSGSRTPGRESSLEQPHADVEETASGDPLRPGNPPVADGYRPPEQSNTPASFSEAEVRRRAAERGLDPDQLVESVRARGMLIEPAAAAPPSQPPTPPATAAAPAPDPKRPKIVSGRLRPRVAKDKSHLAALADLVRPVGSRIAREGEAGKELFDLIDRATDVGEQKGGARVEKLKNEARIYDLTRDQKFNLVEALEGRADPDSPEAQKALEVIRGITEVMADEAADAGVKVKIKRFLHPFEEVPKGAKLTPIQMRSREKGRRVYIQYEREYRPRRHFYPHRIQGADMLSKGPIREDVAENLVRMGIRGTLGDAAQFIDAYVDFLDSGERSAIIIQHLLDSGQALTPAEALGQLMRFRKRTIKREGSLEYSREIDLPFWDPDPARVLPGFVAKTSARMAQIVGFGQKNEQVNKLINEVREAGGDADFVRHAVDQILGIVNEPDTGARRAMRALRIIEGFKMGLSAITNVTQGPLNTLLAADLRAVIKGASGPFTEVGRSFAIESGAATENVIHEAMVATSAANKLLGQFLTAVQFPRTEFWNRSGSAIAGADYAVRMLKKLQKNSNDSRARDLLERLGVGVEDAVKRGSLTEQEFMIAGKRFSDQTQGRQRVQDLPMGVTTELGRTITQFKSFGYNQARLVAREVIGEFRAAANGGGSARFGRGLRSLLLILTVFPVAGELVADLRSVLTGKERTGGKPLKKLLSGRVHSALRGKGTEELLARYVEDLFQIGTFGLVSDMAQAAWYGRLADLFIGAGAGDAVSLIEAGAKDAKKEIPVLTQNRKLSKTPGRNVGREVVRRVPLLGPIIVNRVFPPLNAGH